LKNPYEIPKRVAVENSNSNCSRLASLYNLCRKARDENKLSQEKEVEYILSKLPIKSFGMYLFKIKRQKLNFI